jgi:NAD(P)-dependent dehydrogenase (short-subunit alcohol dehydrogenase family)
MNMRSLQDDVVLVVGGGSGLGRGLVDCFLAEGANVAVLEVEEDKAEILRAETHPDRVAVIVGDVRTYADNERAVSAAVGTFGRLDTLIQCAGITDWTPAFKLLPNDKIPAAFDDIMGTNVLGAILSAKAALPELQKTGGSMVFTLSSSAFFPGGQGAIYTLSKHALVGLVRQLAYESAPRVRVNGVVPGAIKESRIRGPEALGQETLFPAVAMPDAAALIMGSNPLRLYPEAADYGPIYVLLADRTRAGVATGSIISWDTGLSIVGHGTALMDALREVPSADDAVSASA